MGQRRRQGRRDEVMPAPRSGPGPQRGFNDPASDAGRYARRPYAGRSPDYNFDPRGGREYGYSGARGSMVSPGWDHWREDEGPRTDFGSGEFGRGDRAPPPSGRDRGAGYAGADFGRHGPRYAGADYGRGAQEPGRSRFDSDDLESERRMRQWQGHRGSSGSDAYGPYTGSRMDDGRSGERSTWGASRERLGRGTSFRGHGPQGYTRTDERLLELICERMTDDPDIDPREVRVQVSGGEVTLEGRVDDRWMKHHIEDLVDACAGVTEIHNRIRVGKQSPGERADAEPGGEDAAGSKARH